MKTGVVLFAHGSRDAAWAAPFRAIERRVAAATNAPVALAFLEIMRPTLGETVDRLVSEGCGRITIAPLFMAQGAHLSRDLAALLADISARHADVEIAALPAVGEVESVADAIGAWIAGAIGTSDLKGPV